ncbi:RHS domain-containing protein [Streptomyces sp. NPDC059835]|uniref:RHS domain-containing protein n=1 Tax=Streptomyces sp. NPDC059835 TaxID=3346967 RepID=UPI0036598EF2
MHLPRGRRSRRHQRHTLRYPPLRPGLGWSSHCGYDDITVTWDHAGLRPLARTERRKDSTDERFFAIVTDLIGTPTELVDESGELAWRTRTTLWGTTTRTRDGAAYTPLRFPGGARPGTEPGDVRQQPTDVE